MLSTAGGGLVESSTPSAPLVRHCRVAHVDTEVTRRKRRKERRVDRRSRPHLLRNQWNEFAPDSEKRAKLKEGLERCLSVYEAAVEAGYSDRHARRLVWWL